MQCVEGLAARRDVYQLLSLLLKLPTQEIASAVQDGELVESIDDMVRQVAPQQTASRREDARVASACVDEPLHALRCDYTQLFTNPEGAKVPIYEACFKDNHAFEASALTFISPTALDAELEYRRWGLEMDAESNESPDHMGAECAFMAAIYGCWAQALEDKNEADCTAAKGALEEFRQKHFLKWAPCFFESVSLYSQTPTYRLVGMLGQLMAETEA